MRRLSVLLLAGLLVPACGGGGSHTIQGELAVLGTCPALTVDKGDPVILRDGDNKTIGTGELGEGKDSNVLGKDAKKLGRDANAFANCVYKFHITDVPDAAFYSVEVGDKGKLTYSRAKLEKRDWKVALTLS